MSDVKWIKVSTDLFSDEKIVFLRNMPDGDSLLTLWIFLLVLAGKINDNGYIYFKENVPYTAQMLSLISHIPQSTVELGLKTMQDFEMIDIDSNGMIILNWEKHQNIKGLEKIREQAKLRTRKYREKLKELSPGNIGSNNSSNSEQCDASRYVTVTHLEEELELDIDKREDSSGHVRDQPVPYSKIVDLYHEICTSLPRIKALSQSRKGYIKARWQEHPDMEFWKEFFTEVESCKFLTGKADYKDRKPFYADLEWLTRPNNFLKVLEGKYQDKEEAVVDAERRAIIENIRRLKAERTQ